MSFSQQNKLCYIVKFFSRTRFGCLLACTPLLFRVDYYFWMYMSNVPRISREISISTHYRILTITLPVNGQHSDWFTERFKWWMYVCWLQNDIVLCKYRITHTASVDSRIRNCSANWLRKVRIKVSVWSPLNINARTI